MKILTYSPYGYTPTNSLTPSLLFNGELHHPIIQAYSLGNGHRFYNHSIMRFLSPDMTSPFGKGGVNTFSYCSGDPINFHDRSGQNRGRVARGPRINRREFAKIRYYNEPDTLSIYVSRRPVKLPAGHDSDNHISRNSHIPSIHEKILSGLEPDDIENLEIAFPQIKIKHTEDFMNAFENRRPSGPISKQHDIVEIKRDFRNLTTEQGMQMLQRTITAARSGYVYTGKHAKIWYDRILNRSYNSEFQDKASHYIQPWQ